MKAVVFAYHDMGCQGVQALLDAGYEIAAIFTPQTRLIIPCGLSALANWHPMLSSRSTIAIY